MAGHETKSSVLMILFLFKSTVRPSILLFQILVTTTILEIECDLSKLNVAVKMKLTCSS